jgi:hypothetical protein
MAVSCDQSKFRINGRKSEEFSKTGAAFSQNDQIFEKEHQFYC